MKTSIPILVVLALMAVLAARAEDLPVSVEPRPKPITLAVVKTWKDLLAQPLIDLGEPNGKVRLGIERLDVAAKGAVTVYALYEDRVPQSNSCSNSGNLGPLEVRDFTENRLEMAMAAERVVWNKGYYLCRQLVFAPKEDHRTIQITDSKGKVYAEAKIALRENEVYHGWSACTESGGEETGQVREVLTELEDGLSYDFSWPGQHDLLPDMEQIKPFFRPRLEDPDAPMAYEDPLPAALPELPSGPKDHLAAGDETVLADLIERMRDEDADAREAAQTELRRWAPRARVFLAGRLGHPDPEVHARILELLRPFKEKLTIRFDGSILHIHSAEWLAPECLEESILLRVWINGKPWRPKGKQNLREKMAQADLCTTDVEVKLSINTKAIEAQSGDTLSIQMLYCPYGTMSQEYGFSRDRTLRIEPFNCLRTPTISNITTWKIP